MIHVEKDFNRIPDSLKNNSLDLDEMLHAVFNDKSKLGYNYNKKLLKELNHVYKNKCSFCESKLYELLLVEQYRPKSKYAWLEYEWSNLILTCSSCSQYKADNFKIEGKKVTTKFQKNIEEWIANSKFLLDEKPFLFHPEIDYPEKYLYFTNDGYIHSDNHRGKYTIDTCNLNRESLIVRRKDIINIFLKKLEYLILLVNKGVTTNEMIKIAKPIFQELQQSTDKSNEFSLLHKNMKENFHEFFLSKFSAKQQYILMQLYELFINKKSSALDFVMKNLKLINAFSENLYVNKQKILPYSIKQLQVENFHGVKKTGFENIPIDTQWIFLTGENGFGKTTILQSLVLGLYGNQDYKKAILSNIAVEFKNRDLNQINNLGTNKFISFKNFVAYGSSRLNILKGGDTTKTTQTYSIFNNDGYLLNIEDVLKRYAFRDKYQNKFKNIIKILCNLMPSIEKIEVKEQGDRDIVLYYEIDEQGTEHPPVEFNELASGYRSIVAMFGDMIIRLSKRQDINSPSDLEGIAIIDELDLHFHPNWQKKLPKLLSDTFPKVQFIVSTHSVIPFLGALENSVFLKVTRDKESGVKLHKLDIDIKNLLPNTILTSPIFDFEGLIPSSNQKIEDIRTEDNYKKLLENDEIKKRLEEFEKGSDDFPDELFE